MVWINEIESAKSFATSSIIGAELWSQEDHQRRLEKKSLHSRRSSTERRLLTGRAGRSDDCGYFKDSDTDESVLDLNEILRVELKNDKRAIVQQTMGRNHEKNNQMM